MVKLPNAMAEADCRVVVVTPNGAKTKKPPKLGFKLNDVIEEVMSTPEGTQAMQDARRWAASTLYAGESQSLQSLRLRLGLQQSDLAKRLHTTQPRISLYERGLEQPNFDMMTRMCQALEVDMNTLSVAITYASSRTVTNVKTSA